VTTWSSANRGDSLLSLLGRKLAVVRVSLLLVLRYTLTLAGLGSIVIGCFLFSLVLGFVVLGVALLVLEWVVKQ
jgi:Zn-dependent protease with chaperone function